MKRTLTTLTVAALAATVSGGLLVGGAGQAGAATKPPWEPDASAVGSLTFYNAQGTTVTSGSINDSPIAPFVEGGSEVRSGDTKATLIGYKPVNNQAPGKWNGHFLSASTTYPNAAAPSPLGAATLPVVTGAVGDDSVAQLVAAVGTTVQAGYQNVYQIRLLTSAGGEGPSATYDAVDIEVTGNTWSEIYPNAGTPTVTSLAVSSTSANYGSAVKLTATVAPAAAGGQVEFLDGSSVLKKVTVASGSATYTTKTLAGGNHKILASFLPAATGGYAGSVSAKTVVTIKALPTSVKLKASKSTVKHGKSLTLTATESPAVGGTVTFKDGSKTLKAVKVHKGKATYATKKLRAGKHTLKAIFKPVSSADYKVSTSKRVKLRVS